MISHKIVINWHHGEPRWLYFYCDSICNFVEIKKWGLGYVLVYETENDTTVPSGILKHITLSILNYQW